MVRAFDVLGATPPGVRLHCVNSIPHGRGLGSSSAAIVGGLALARALVVDGDRLLDDEALFRLAAELEGHPDNVAPAVFGALTVAYSDDQAVRRGAPRGDLARGLRGVRPRARRPHEGRSGAAAADGLPPGRLLQRGAGGTARGGPHRGQPDLLLSATEDRLHQGYRAAAMPASAELIEVLRGARVPAVLSGAGPTVLAVVDPGQVADVAATAPPGGRRPSSSSTGSACACCPDAPPVVTCP